MMQTQLDEFTATQIKAHWMCVALVKMSQELRKVGLKLKQEHGYSVRLALNDAHVAIALVKSRCKAQGVDFRPILEITQFVKGDTKASLIASCFNAADGLTWAKERIERKSRKLHKERKPTSKPVVSSGLPDLGLSTVNNALDNDGVAVIRDLLEGTGGAIRRRPDYFKAHVMTSYGRR